MHAEAIEHDGLVVFVRHQFGQRREGAIETSRLRHAVSLGKFGFLRHFGHELRRGDDLSAVFRNARVGRRSIGFRGGARLRCQ